MKKFVVLLKTGGPDHDQIVEADRVDLKNGALQFWKTIKVRIPANEYNNRFNPPITVTPRGGRQTAEPAVPIQQPEYIVQDTTVMVKWFNWSDIISVSLNEDDVVVHTTTE